MRPLTRESSEAVLLTKLERRVAANERRYNIAGRFEIKVFADAGALDGNLDDTATVVSVGDGKFIFAIPPDLDQTHLILAEAFVSTDGADDLEVMIRNITQAQDMLSGPIVIPAGDFASYPPVATEIDDANSQVDSADLIAIDVDADGGGAQGLGVIIFFSF